MGIFCKMECCLVRLLGLYYEKKEECSTQSFLVGKLNVNICFSGIYYKFMAWQVVMIHPWHCLLLTHCMGIVCIGDPGKAHVMCEWLNLAQKHPSQPLLAAPKEKKRLSHLCVGFWDKNSLLEILEEPICEWQLESEAVLFGGVLERNVWVAAGNVSCNH